jgi:AraC-like DNA-binding protein
MPETSRDDGFTVARTREPEVAREVAARFGLPHRLELPRGCCEVDMELVGYRLGAVTVGRLSYGRSVRLRTDEGDTVHVNAPLSGRARTASGAECSVTEPGEAAVFSTETPADLRWTADCVQLCVMFPRRALESELEQSLGRSLHEPLRFATIMDLSTPAGAGWREALGTAARELEHRCGLATHPFTSRHLERLLIAGLLLAQPHNYSEALEGSVRAGPRSAIAAAVELLEDRSDEPWTTATLARAVHVSVRSLQEGFRRDLGTPPMTYLRTVRLRRVREILQRLPPWSTTVEAVAARQGFVHMGRFAATYRLTFGEMPSTTLARRPESSR